MAETPSQFPLQWPPFIPRSKARESYPGSGSRLTLSTALTNVRDSLRKFGNDSGRPVKEVVLSSNVSLGISHPPDPGVAVWFMWENEWRCIAVDRFHYPEHNLQGIHKIVEARRAETRYGTLHMVRAAFTGFLALPGGGIVDWRKTLGLTGAQVTMDEAEAAYMRLAPEAHPDHGGTAEAMSALNAARAAARRELAPAS